MFLQVINSLKLLQISEIAPFAQISATFCAHIEEVWSEVVSFSWNGNVTILRLTLRFWSENIPVKKLME